MELSQDLNHAPLVVLRFNPDSYKEKHSRQIKSCWKMNYVEICVVRDQIEWN